ncbi:sulfatase-like hydrolase/transferase [soil metagenome]
MSISNKLLLLFFILTMACQVPLKDEPGQNGRSGTPNIVLLLTDDQTYKTIGALGNDEIYTPNIDRLVNGGVTFTHAFNMGGWNGAVCIASRSMIISGQSIWRAQQKDSLWRKNDTTAFSQTWGRLMKQHGYNTYMSGKWHVQAPPDQVFATVRHVRPGMPSDSWGKGGGDKKVAEAFKNNADVVAAMPVGYNRPIDENDNSWSPTDPKFGGFWEGGQHWSEVLKNDALAFIKDASKREDPFFMYLAFNAPHDPRQSPQEFIDKYPIENISLPKSFLPQYPWKDSIGNSQLLRDEALAPFPRTEYAVKKHRQEYYAIITHLDEQIGEILDALEESGKMGNTYIFLTSDHGLAIGEHGLIGKQNMFDHSIRVPLIVSGPDIPKGKKLGQDVYLQDIMATSLELAGIEKPAYVDFHSFLDIINGESTKSHYDEIYGCYMDYQRMIRKEGYKLIVYPRIKKVLLFDLEKDAEEINNLADISKYKEKVKKLFNELVDLQNAMGDKLDLSYVQSDLNTRL